MYFNNIICTKGVSSQIKNKNNCKNQTIKNINELACKLNYKFLPIFITNSIAEDLKKQAN